MIYNVILLLDLTINSTWYLFTTNILSNTSETARLCGPNCWAVYLTKTGFITLSHFGPNSKPNSKSYQSIDKWFGDVIPNVKYVVSNPRKGIRYLIREINHKLCFIFVVWEVRCKHSFFYFVICLRPTSSEIYWWDKPLSSHKFYFPFFGTHILPKPPTNFSTYSFIAALTHWLRN